MAEEPRARKALSIAGSDSGGGAGIQADLKTFSALGVYGATAIAAVTAQNTLGVDSWMAMPPELVAAQIDAVMRDIWADAAKTGMLANAAIIEVVAEKVREYGIERLVVDPVMVAKGGNRLLEDEATEAMRSKLLPLALVATPNVPEAEALTGRRIESWEDVRRAAKEIAGLGPRCVVVKGGHMTGPATDILWDGQEFREYSALRSDTKNTHGTGCTFSAGIAAGLARGEDVRASVALGKSFVTRAMQSAFDVGRGQGPVHHFYRYWRPL